MASLMNLPPHTYAAFSASSSNEFFPRTAVSVPPFQKFPEKDIIISSSSISNGVPQLYNSTNNNFTELTDPIFFPEASFYDYIPDPDPCFSSYSPSVEFPPLFPVLPETFNYPFTQDPVNSDFHASVPKLPCLENAGFSPFQNDGFFPGLPGIIPPVPAPLPCVPPQQVGLSYCDQIPIMQSDYREETKVREEKIVSAQSLAARGRRRRITVKTAELGKLVPGGGQMNTAEMLGAAFKYIVFLKTQIAVLQFMSSHYQEDGEEDEMEELWNLLESAEVQEKLYMEGNCLVLKNSLNRLLNHHNSLSPSIFDQLKQFLS